MPSPPRRPKVALDATQLVLEARTGNRRTWMNLVPAMAARAPDLDFLPWMGFWRPVAGHRPPAWTQGNVHNRCLRIPRRWIEAAWDRGWLATEAFLPGADLFHSIFRYLPPSRTCSRILTVYDIREVLFPTLYPTWRETRARLTRDLERAEVVVAPSRAVARELTEHFPECEPRLTTLRSGAVEPLFFAPPRGPEALARLGIQGPYALTIGSGDPRKNIPHLARAFAAWRQRTGSPLKLVVVGAAHPSYAEIPAEDVQFTDLIDDDDWRDLLSLSQALIYPSLYEGFGLPALEAMAAGTLLLASTAVPVAVEELSEACLLFHPTRDEELWRALSQLEGMSPEERARRRESGRALAASFSWDRLAGAYVELYREILARPRRLPSRGR